MRLVGFPVLFGSERIGKRTDARRRHQGSEAPRERQKRNREWTRINANKNKCKEERCKEKTSADYADFADKRKRIQVDIRDGQDKSSKKNGGFVRAGHPQDLK